MFWNDLLIHSKTSGQRWENEAVSLCLLQWIVQRTISYSADTTEPQIYHCDHCYFSDFVFFHSCDTCFKTNIHLCLDNVFSMVVTWSCRCSWYQLENGGCCRVSHRRGDLLVVHLTSDVCPVQHPLSHWTQQWTQSPWEQSTSSDSTTNKYA